MLKRTIGGMSALALLAGAGLLGGGCKSWFQEKKQGEELCYVFVKINKHENANNAACLRLFEPKTAAAGLAQQTVAAGVTLPSRVLTNSEVYFISEGAGMVEVNDIAYVLRTNSGIYVPSGCKFMMYNNSGKPMKYAMAPKTLFWINGLPLTRPMVFDKNAPRVGESRTYDEIVGNRPESLAPETLKTTRLTPSEAKVKTLQQDLNQ